MQDARLERLKRHGLDDVAVDARLHDGGDRGFVGISRDHDDGRTLENRVRAHALQQI